MALSTFFYTIVILLSLTDVLNVHGHYCADINEVTLQVSASNCTHTTTTGSYQCQDLQTALQFIVNNDTECHVFYVQLEAGVHVIREPISTPSSVHINSSSVTEEQTIITCGYNASRVRLDGQLHSIYFIQSNSVTISDVTMEGCPLPLRLFEVRNVKFQNSSFRYSYHIATQSHAHTQTYT